MSTALFPWERVHFSYLDFHLLNLLITVVLMPKPNPIYSSLHRKRAYFRGTNGTHHIYLLYLMMTKQYKIKRNPCFLRVLQWGDEDRPLKKIHFEEFPSLGKQFRTQCWWDFNRKLRLYNVSYIHLLVNRQEFGFLFF